MQTSLDLFATPGDDEKLTFNPQADVKAALENYIQVCGLVAFKDYFMKAKRGEVENIPESVTLSDYLAICRQVYQERAFRVERQKKRGNFFAVRNRIKRKKI
ncbi:MAG: hypothetical protein V4619_15515 [Bacteroidota bacterium]